MRWSPGRPAFSCKFPHKMALVKCPCAFPLRRLAQNACRGIGVHHFSYKFPNQIALVKCPCAFRLRRLTVPWSVPSHFSCKFPHKMALVTCPCAFRQRRLTQSVLPGLGIGVPPQHHPPQHRHLPPRPQHPPHHIIITITITIIIIIIISIIIIIITIITIIIINIILLILILIFIIIIIIIIILIIIITTTKSAVPFLLPPTLFGVSCRDNFWKQSFCTIQILVSQTFCKLRVHFPIDPCGQKCLAYEY